MHRLSSSGCKLFAYDMLSLLVVVLKVVGFHSNKSAAEKSYILALCRILVLLCFKLSQDSEQGPIKLLRQLLNCVAQSLASERELLKELKKMVERLKAVDRCPDEKLSSDEANFIFGNELFCHIHC